MKIYMQIYMCGNFYANFIISLLVEKKTICSQMFGAISLLSPCPLPSPLSFSPSAAICFLKKDEPGRGRTCNLQIRSLTRFHCATGPYIIIPYSLFLSFARRLPRLPYSYSIIGRFISSRIHPFPSEHGSKDAQSLFSTVMFTQTGTSGNLPFWLFIKRYFSKRKQTQISEKLYM